MAKNYLTRFATSSDANVLTDAELAAQPELASGFIAKSKASSKLIGKLIQNATAGSAALGEYIATKTQQDVSATDADLGTKLTNAITAHIKAEAPKQDLSGYATKSEVTEGLATKAAVKHTHTVDEVTNAVAYTTAAGRRSIVLQNDNDSIAGLNTSAASVNLLRVTRFDRVDIGAIQLPTNINSKDNIVYINDTYQIATTENLQQTSDSITAELAKKAPLANPTFNGTVTGTFKGNITGNVTGNSSTATKATQDASGNVITTTYATKTEVSKKLDANTYTTDKATFALKTELTPLMPKSGGAFTGAVTVLAPTANMHPATKQYVDAAVSAVYKYKGSVSTEAELPKDSQTIGDVYNVEDTGMNVAWDGTKWDKLGSVVDLSGYATTASVNTQLAKKAPLASPAFTGTVTGTFKGNVTGNATSATKATQDASGNVITTTYATKTELDTKAPLASPTFTGTVTAPTFAGALTGNATTATTAATASKLATARTIAIAGAVTGTATSFDGSANISINTTAVAGAKVTGTVPAATKATQDSAGQAINTTYIKDLSVSGKVITFTRGDNTTGTITTQDTNTTYSNMTAATADVAGKAGLVPAPAAGAQAKFLRGDGTWQVPTSTDSKVLQTVSTTAGEFALLAKDQTDVTTTTSGSVFASGVTVNPSTKTITATTFNGALSGNATTATTATTANKTKAVLTLQMNGGSAQTFDGSTAGTFNVTAAGIGALPTSGGTVSGSLTVNNALKAASITATSDIRLKNIINRYSTQSALYNLSAVDFSFKGSDDSVHTGLIAQEVQELYPALVKEDEHGYLSIDYCGVTALLVNDMKHLLNKISRLEQQIEVIKRDI